MGFTAIVAYDCCRGIGKSNSIPWDIKEDLRRFGKITKNGIIVMGRKTYDSLPKRPLRKRINVILSRSKVLTAEEESSGIVVVHRTVNSCLDYLMTFATTNKKIFIIGGSEIYKVFLDMGLVDHVMATEISGNFNCDTFFPKLPKGCFVKAQEVKCNMLYSYVDYKAVGNPEELQYTQLIKDVLTTGIPRQNRTSVTTLSCFGRTLRFSLQDNRCPVLTTKRVFWRGVVEELLWFCRGDTNAKTLSDRRVKIWDANGTREFLDSRGLHDNKVGDLGPVYGFQWRHFNAKYGTCDDDYSDKGVDQLRNVIELLKKSPNTRRAIISAWNPCQLDDMALPPCHVSYQFWISSKGLHCALYQRSGDIGLGIPFNIASASLLTIMIARAVGVPAYEFVHFIADAHIYYNHTTQLRRQMLRHPRPGPTVTFKDNTPLMPWLIKPDDIELSGYTPCPGVKMNMVV